MLIFFLISIMRQYLRVIMIIYNRTQEMNVGSFSQCQCRTIALEEFGSESLEFSASQMKPRKEEAKGESQTRHALHMPTSFLRH